MIHKILSGLAFVAILSIMTSCEKEDPDIPNQEELITTLTYTLTPVAGGNAIVLSFKDLDGDGGDAPILTGGALTANQEYMGTLILLNESVTPTESISDEVKEEDDEHQFFFQSSIAGVEITYTDMDADGNPLGLKTTLKTGDAGSGNLTIILRHLPIKTATGVSDGDITNAKGETDIEVAFSLDVQ
jgi:hypothetical protein|tara:strand:+ start:1423 stop:1983 length:561 start_codon:yes stop_codon:yes gene_type:complete